MENPKLEKSIKKLLNAISEFGDVSGGIDNLASILESQVVDFMKKNKIELKNYS